ncbi:MAG: type II toxin-antitoxin system HicA family toxin [Candidatus Micrarchaeota archaeon]
MRLTPIPGKKLIKLLNLLGYLEVRHKGSHAILENAQTKKITIVPIRSKDVGVGLILVILREVGISREEYFELLKKI